MATTLKLEYRRDGWPLCPQCGEDELMSCRPPIDKRKQPRQPKPTDEMRCLACRWNGCVPTAREAAACGK